MRNLLNLKWKDLFEKGKSLQASGDDTTSAGEVVDKTARHGGRTTPSQRLQKTGLGTLREKVFTKAKLIDLYAKELRVSKGNGKGVTFDVCNISFSSRASDDDGRIPLLDAVKKATRKTHLSNPTLSGSFTGCTFNGVSFAELSLENSQFLDGSIEDCLFGEVNPLVRDLARQRVIQSCEFTCSIKKSDFIHVDIINTNFDGSLINVRFNEGGPPTNGRVEHTEISQGTKFRSLSGSRFHLVCFSQVEFRADMTDVHFVHCKFLIGQDQSRILWPNNLRKVTFKHCELRGIDWSNCDFVDCTFTNCTFVECRFSQTNFRGSTSIDGESCFQICEFIQTTFKGNDCGIPGAPGSQRQMGSGVRLQGLKFERCRLDGPKFQRVLLEAPIRLEQCEMHNVEMDNVYIDRINGEIEFVQGSLRGMKFSFKNADSSSRRAFCLMSCCFENVVLTNIPRAAIGLQESDNESYFCRDEQLAGELVGKGSEWQWRLDCAAKFYGQLYRICLEESDPTAAGEFFFRMMVAKTKTSPKVWRKLGYQVANLFCGYGERIWRVVFLSFAVVLLWAGGFLMNGLWIDDQVFYYGLVPRAEVEAAYRGEGEEGVVLGDFDLARFREDFTDAVRLSANVFTSMGEESIRQPNRFGSLLVATESFLGVFVTALFVSVFFRKIAR